MNTHAHPCIYPAAIARACSALDESEILRDMPDGFFRVLVRIVKKINLARLDAPIVASRGTLAAESGKSIETVGRAVKWLEDHGLVQRSQKARAGLRGSSSPLVPTPALLDALLLTNAPPSPREKESAARAHATGVSYPQASALIPVNPDASISGGVHNSLSENNRNGLFVKMENKTIPADLAWLVHKGMRATGVLALMKQAKEMKQRLSDVVAVAKKYIAPLPVAAMFGYLKAMLGQNKDYSSVHHTEVTKATNEAKLKYLAIKSEALQGRQFTTRKGDVLVVVEESGLLTEIRNGIRVCRRMDQNFLDAIEAARLIPAR